MKSSFVYQTRTPEQWQARADQISPEYRHAVAQLVLLSAEKFWRGYQTEGEEMHYFDCWDSPDECGERLRDLDQTELDAAFDTEYKRRGAYEDPVHEAELRLIEVERVLDGARP